MNKGFAPAINTSAFCLEFVFFSSFLQVDRKVFNNGTFLAKEWKVNEDRLRFSNVLSL